MSIKKKKILVVYKANPFNNLIRKFSHHKNDANIRTLIHARSVHLDTLKKIRSLLKKSSYSCDIVALPDVTALNEKKYFLIMTIGGDGTFLDISHNVYKTPMLGINSSPEYSEGFYTSLNRLDVESRLLDMIENPPEPVFLNRMKIYMNEKALKQEALNDVLVCHCEPGATSRYILSAGANTVADKQKGSGVWISTAGGSSAGIYSAGGVKMPVLSKKLQFLARELYVSEKRKNKLKKGMIKEGESIVITSLMEKGVVYIDGPHTRYKFPYRSKLKIQNSKTPLPVLGLDINKRMK